MDASSEARAIAVNIAKAMHKAPLSAKALVEEANIIADFITSGKLPPADEKTKVTVAKVSTPTSIRKKASK